MVGQGNPQLTEELLLFGTGCGDAAQADLTALGGGQNDVGALERGKQRQRLGRGEVRVLAPQQMLQRDPERIAQEGHQDVRLHARFELMKQRPDRQLALQSPKSSFRFGELDVFVPKFFRGFALEVGAQQISSLDGPGNGRAACY